MVLWKHLSARYISCFAAGVRALLGACIIISHNHRRRLPVVPPAADPPVQRPKKNGIGDFTRFF